MFVARYDTYAIYLLADEALQWRRALTAGQREDKLIGLELTLDTGKKLQSMPKKTTQVTVSRSSPALTPTRSPSLPMRPCSGCEYSLQARGRTS